MITGRGWGSLEASRLSRTEKRKKFYWILQLSADTTNAKNVIIEGYYEGQQKIIMGQREIDYL